MSQSTIVSSPTATSHAGGITLVAMIHTNITSPTLVNNVGESSPTSIHHVGDAPPTFGSRTKIMSPSIGSDAREIHMIENHRCIERKLNFLCILCKGGNLTRLLPTLVIVEELQSLSENH
jgi:hypothetical protein